MRTVAKIVFWFCAVAICLTMLLLGMPAKADTWVTSTVTSYHFDRSIKHNEFNAGLGGEYDVKDYARLVGGFYDNSNHHPSIYFGAALTPLKIGSVRLGILGGLVNGYGQNPNNFGPLVAPIVQIEGRQFGLNILGAPRIPGICDGVIALQLKIKLEKDAP